MSQIKVHHLTFCYDGAVSPVFSDLSFSLDTVWKTGLIGRNGRGKTTLLRLLAGQLPAKGVLASPGECRMFPFPIEHPERTTREVLEDQFSAGEEWRFLREAQALDLSEEVLDRPFHSLSGGEQTKAMLAALFQEEDRFLLLDEPTNHLDQRGRETVAKYLQSKQGFLLVCHDRDFLDRCIDHVLVLNREEVEVQRGNYSSWQENRDRKDQFEQEENRKLQKEIRSLNAAARRAAGWSDRLESTKIGQGVADRGFVGHRSAKMMKRAKGLERRKERAAEEKGRLLHNIETADELTVRPLIYPKTRLLAVQGVTVDYGSGPVCAPVSFTVTSGERIALQGPNGSGKSSLLQAILGTVPYAGSLHQGQGLKISVIPQSTAFLQGPVRVWCQQEVEDQVLFFTLLRKLGFPRELLEQRMERMSEGQKKKILLARSLSQKAHLYLWDEPLNYIDIPSRRQIEELLVQCQPTLLFVEHDRRFEERVATQVVTLKKT